MNNPNKLRRKNFPTARDEAKKSRLTPPRYTHPSYRLAFTDTDFLLREELRPVRFQLELLKPDMVQQEHKIDSTVVIFGSARFKSREESDELVRKARAEADAHPKSARAKQALAEAERFMRNAHYYEEARRLGEIISRKGQHIPNCQMVVVTGGGPGIMEAANRGAFETGGKSIGLNIILPMEQEPNPYITPELCFQFHYFALRKMHFLIRAKALVAFPGGYGTLDELFETLTLIQTGKVERVPILLFGKEFWNRLVDFDVMVEDGTVSPEDLDLIEYVDTAEDAWACIARFYRLE